MLTRERAPAPSFLPAGFVDPAPAIFARLDRVGVLPTSPEFDASLIRPTRCRVAPNSGAMPAPLPNLREALARRAEAFGPWDGDEPEPAPRGALARCAAALRGLANLLDPQAVPC